MIPYDDEQSKQTDNSYMLFFGDQIEAEYFKHRSRRLAGNPFQEALHPVLSKEEVMRHMTYVPDYDEEERTQLATERIICLQDLEEFFIPTTVHTDVFHTVDMLIRNGYMMAGRNPLSKHYHKYLKSGSIRQDHSGQCVFGWSGTGKSKSVEISLSYFPQVITHGKYENTYLTAVQIVWLKLDCPKNGSLIELCNSFFRAVDELLGHDPESEDSYFSKYANSDDPIGHVGQVAKLVNLGLLVIDEMQALYEIELASRSGGQIPNEFVTGLTRLADNIGIPVYLIGTLTAQLALQKKFYIGRRFSSTGDLLFEPFAEDSENWLLFSDTLWYLQYTSTHCPLTPELRHILFNQSLGIPAVAVKIYKAAQYRAIMHSTGKEEITPQLLKGIVKADFPRLYEALEMLRSSGKTEWLEYEKWYLDTIHTNRGKPNPPPPEPLQDDRDDIRPTASSRPIEEQSDSRPPTGKRKLDDPPQDSIMYIYQYAEEQGIDFYHALLEADLICDLHQFTA